MVTHMKTTVEIPDDLFKRAKNLAAAEETTLKSLLVEGLRWVLRQRKKPSRFRLKDRSVSGQGVQPGISEGEWEQLRGLIYKGRGT